MQTASVAKYQVLKLKHLPPLSATAVQLLELLADENQSLEKLAHVISQDPGIAARILGVANSAYFAQTKPVLTIEDAIIRVLGLNMVRSLSFSLAVSGAFDTKQCPNFNLETYWYQALATAALSRMFVGHIAQADKSDPDFVYLSGLLFDIGTLVLVHLYPDSYATVLARAEGADRESLSQLEEELVGISSRDAGGWLLARWHLPQTVVQVVQQNDQDGGIEPTLVAMAADWICQGVNQEIDTTGYSQMIPNEEIEIVQAEFLRQDEDIRTIANLLAN
jgi:HD-like signal output (HDOD) protein